MRVLVLGGTGFIGRALIPILLERGHTVAVASRSAGKVAALFGPKVEGVAASVERSETVTAWLQRESSPCALINLAGESIAAGRWSRRVFPVGIG